jgi:hypothetical protein
MPYELSKDEDLDGLESIEPMLDFVSLRLDKLATEAFLGDELDESFGPIGDC